MNRHGQDGHATGGITIRHGAYLPHWTREGAIYAVTFRLVDSLLKSVMESWKFEREDIVNTARQMHRPLSAAEESRLDKLFSESKEANRLIGRTGQFWQPEPYDHLIRDEEDLRRQVEYVLTNPARAGLKNWKWVGRGKGCDVARASRP